MKTMETNSIKEESRNFFGKNPSLIKSHLKAAKYHEEGNHKKGTPNLISAQGSVNRSNKA